jgi:hypothetical protein
MEILEWISVDGNGLSAKAIACAALGQVPKRPNYPHDGDDFGRCYRLLIAVPGARAGLERLGKDGGPIWVALVANWPEIEAAYLHDLGLGDDWKANRGKYKCYELMKSIIHPIEDAERSVFRMGDGVSIHL